METSVISPRKITPPSICACEALPEGAAVSFRTRRQKQVQGTGYIESKSIKRQGKEYKQYWYHYEEWWSGELCIKSSKYIPREKEGKIFRMNDKKAPVEKILKVLESKSKRK